MVASAYPSAAGCEAPAEPVGQDWRVATSMRRKDAPQYGFGTYVAADYDELIDHPVEIGNLLIGEFEAGGIPHAIAVRGHTRIDVARIEQGKVQLERLRIVVKTARSRRASLEVVQARNETSYFVVAPRDGTGEIRLTREIQHDADTAAPSRDSTAPSRRPRCCAATTSSSPRCRRNGAPPASTTGHLDDRRDPLAHADAHGGNAEGRIAVDHVVDGQLQHLEIASLARPGDPGRHGVPPPQ